MDKASDFGSEDCEFESRRGRSNFVKVQLSMDLTKSGYHISRIEHRYVFYFDGGSWPGT